MASNLRSASQNFDNNGKPFRPTIKPTPNFNVEADVDALCKSMRCWGTDEATIINILGRRTSSERQRIVETYKKKFSRELARDLDGDLSGHFRDLAILLTETPIYLMAKSLYYAMKGVGTNENTIIEILVSCTNEEIIQLKTAYVHVLRDKGIKDPQRSLEGDIRSETSGFFCKMLMQILRAETADPTPEQLKTLQTSGGSCMVDQNQIVTLVSQIRAVLEKPPNVCHPVLMESFKNKNIWELSEMEKEYKKTTGVSLIKAVGDAVSGEFGTLLVAMVEHAVDRPRFYAELLYQSMIGAGTRDFLLMRVMVLRSEIDLLDIKEKFETEHQSLIDCIKGDTSGDYETLLLTLLNAPTK